MVEKSKSHKFAHHITILSQTTKATSTISVRHIHIHSYIHVIDLATVDIKNILQSIKIMSFQGLITHYRGSLWNFSVDAIHHVSLYKRNPLLLLIH